jgi:hypothetical protein
MDEGGTVATYFEDVNDAATAHDELRALIRKLVDEEFGRGDAEARLRSALGPVVIQAPSADFSLRASPPSVRVLEPTAGPSASDLGARFDVQFAAEYVAPPASHAVVDAAMRAAPGLRDKVAELAKSIGTEVVVAVVAGAIIARLQGSEPAIQNVSNVTNISITYVTNAAPAQPPPVATPGEERAPSMSPLARVVLDLLAPAPGTAVDLARESKLPVGVVEIALAELRGAGRAEEVQPGVWKAIRRPSTAHHT